MSENNKSLLPEVKEDRAHERFPVALKGNIQILIPESTFRPHQHNCEVLDLSQGGMRVRVENMNKFLFLELLKTVRLVRMTFHEPSTTELPKVVGSIRWINYEKDRTDEESAPCHLGICIDPSQTNVAQYSQFLAYLAVN
jgi:hypothetical protein